MSVWCTVQQVAKAVIGFAVVFVGQLLANTTDQGIPLPHNKSGWLSLIGFSLVGAFGVYGIGNRYSPPQVAAKYHKLQPQEQQEVKQLVANPPPPKKRRAPKKRPPTSTGMSTGSPPPTGR